MPLPGQILFHSNFQFSDGGYGQKICIVLNASGPDIPCLVLKTTSNVERYNNCKPGCNSQRKVYFAPKDLHPCFNKDTYIQLPEIFELSTIDLLVGALAKHITFFDITLTQDCFNQLLKCLRYFEEDIAISHWELIFKKHRVH